ncbi:claudin-34-like [Cololabis saira]|uniref:claudin-34-like n=1 Tax=Cololabis saira TaxID=129043 RepID=UPI002AD42077|nr:claudin-34-like [Cololabis saira]
MTYLAHTAHSQFGALWLSFIGWTLTTMALGLVQWRVWQVSDRGVVTSGVAWVGLWRACFNSHTEVSDGLRVMYCRSIRLTETFTPPEIAAGQVLMMLSLLVGLCGNASGVYAMRNAYFGLGRSSKINLRFVTTGALCLLAAVMSLVPLLWNLSSVVTNQTITFPPEFKLPTAPQSQSVGWGIWVGVMGSALSIVSGIIFCSYKLPVMLRPRTLPLREQLHWDGSSATPDTQGAVAVSCGRDNPAFQSEEHL